MEEEVSVEKKHSEKNLTITGACKMFQLFISGPLFKLIKLILGLKQGLENFSQINLT